MTKNWMTLVREYRKGIFLIVLKSDLANQIIFCVMLALFNPASSMVFIGSLSGFGGKPATN